ncbi:MAG: HupE/UreJ family protein [Luteolibacter sp.]
MSIARSGAHEVSSVEFEFQGLPEQWRLIGQMDIAYMLPETRDLPGSLPLSRTAVMKEKPEVLGRMRTETEKRLRELLTLKFNGKTLPWKIEFPDFDKQPFELPEETGDWALLSTRIFIEPQQGPGELRAYWDKSVQSELIVTIEKGDDFQVLSARGGSDMLLMKLEGSPESPARATHADRLESLKGWLETGYNHVLPFSTFLLAGMDHILFMLGLFLLLPKWKPLMAQSLLFTLAHSFTLSLTVLNLIHIPGRVLDTLIAASIAWIGIENLFVKTLGRHRYILIGCFGMLHGMGFASGLKDKVGNVPHSQLFIPILGFNLGVELAQISVLCMAFLLTWPIRRWTHNVRIYGSLLVAGAGLFWMFERLLG